GPGYGTSKCKWLMNATMYFDTTLPQANLGLNPFYGRIGQFFRRVIPVGMNHNAWGNQANASRNNHLAHFRKFAYLTGDGRFLLNWQQYGGREFSSFRPWIEYVLPAYYDKPGPEPESDAVAIFPVAGWAMAATGPPSLRSTFDNGLGLIFQCRPRGGYGHSFNSDGSFQFHAYGQMLNHGGGSSANRDAFAYHTMSHNTILVDGLGQAQPSAGQLYPHYGRLAAFSRGEDYVYFAGDATGCYPRAPGKYSRWSLPLHQVYQERALPHLERFIRHVLFMRGRYFVIYDELSCSRPATYTWLYHILPQEPYRFDEGTFAVDYAVGNVDVRLRHLAHPEGLELDDRVGMEAFVNPLTGEDYSRWRRDEILCGHNLWVSNAEPARQWRFLAVIYPAQPGTTIPAIERLDDSTVRVAGDVLSFDLDSPYAADASLVVDTAAMAEALKRDWK
ncbi:MAG: heparinase II/III domain-containing protein, partial [Planctomycetota bacterium]